MNGKGSRIQKEVLGALGKMFTWTSHQGFTMANGMAGHHGGQLAGCIPHRPLTL